MAYELHHGELKVVLRDQFDNIGHGYADPTIADVIEWLLEEEGAEVWEHNGDPSVAVKAGRYLLLRLPEES